MRDTNWKSSNKIIILDEWTLLTLKISSLSEGLILLNLLFYLFFRIALFMFHLLRSRIDLGPFLFMTPLEIDLNGGSILRFFNFFLLRSEMFFPYFRRGGLFCIQAKQESQLIDIKKINTGICGCHLWYKPY